MYNITMFAYNEADNIESSIESVYQNVDAQLDTFFLIANGCSDSTVAIAKAKKETLDFDEMEIIELELGDKCNAWNTYVHTLSGEQLTHFFCDADVSFSEQCFNILHTQLQGSGESTSVVAGMPLSGRNVDFYRQLVIERSCFFGNLYGVRLPFIERIKETGFKLPIGLNWIDSFLTKAVNTDLSFGPHNIPNRTTWVENCGYRFSSLSVFKMDNIKLYISRIARYELGKLQEVILDTLALRDWPQSMHEINLVIEKEFDQRSKDLGPIKTYLVKKRLARLIAAKK